jgi:thiosulfate/3-mercaptopyruvate sulfurtransferase
MKKLLSLATLLFVVVALNAQDLISVMDLNKAIMKKKVTVIDARSDAKYKADAHIKNAIHVAYDELAQTAPIKGLLKSTDEIAKILGEKGLAADKPIVVYDEGSGKYAGRMYWILKYMGATDVKMLDGNMKEWKAKRKPITKNPTMAKKATFTPNVNAAIYASIKDVKAGGATVIDVRPAAEYNGTDGKSKGHIPGALNIEFVNVLNDKGLMKSNEEIASVFAKAPKSKPVILYCATSVRAGVVYLALTKAGYTNVKVYDGAFNEWTADAANKVEK